jgi:hypothetical protein
MSMKLRMGIISIDSWLVEYQPVRALSLLEGRLVVKVKMLTHRLRHGFGWQSIEMFSGWDGPDLFYGARCPKCGKVSWQHTVHGCWPSVDADDQPMPVQLKLRMPKDWMSPSP